MSCRGVSPDNVEQWVHELRALPSNASYAEWMFQHPDGRRWIGFLDCRGTSALAFRRIVDVALGVSLAMDAAVHDGGRTLLLIPPGVRLGKTQKNAIERYLERTGLHQTRGVSMAEDELATSGWLTSPSSPRRRGASVARRPLLAGLRAQLGELTLRTTMPVRKRTRQRGWPRSSRASALRSIAFTKSAFPRV